MQINSNSSGMSKVKGWSFAIIFGSMDSGGGGGAKLRPHSKSEWWKPVSWTERPVYSFYRKRSPMNSDEKHFRLLFVDQKKKKNFLSTFWPTKQLFVEFFL